MDKAVIKEALSIALYLISNEYQALWDKDLKEGYQEAIDKQRLTKKA